ncbi:MAG TPA: hypothetical protein VLB44_09195, partial [Kofleriaceae bacterium]|nr:hypothetical protein [Kofleriaceae bacterium]
MGRPVRGASGVVRALLLAAACAGCYEEPTATCVIRCTPSDPNSCPGDLTCNAAGLCNTGGAACSGPSIAWSSIGLGARHACGRSLTGDIYCWGDNSVGQLATGMSGDVIATPTKVMAGPFKALAVGAEHSCALDDA